jgi:hypothetical protein
MLGSATYPAISTSSKYYLRLLPVSADRERELKITRRAYAKQVAAAAGVEDPRIEAAFAAVAREDFLGPGPWQIVRWDGGYRASPDADPVYLYTDVRGASSRCLSGKPRAATRSWSARNFCCRRSTCVLASGPSSLLSPAAVLLSLSR